MRRACPAGRPVRRQRHVPTRVLRTCEHAGDCHHRSGRPNLRDRRFRGPRYPLPQPTPSPPNVSMPRNRLDGSPRPPPGVVRGRLTLPRGRACGYARPSPRPLPRRSTRPADLPSIHAAGSKGTNGPLTPGGIRRAGCIGQEDLVAAVAERWPGESGSAAGLPVAHRRRFSTWAHAQGVTRMPGSPRRPCPRCAPPSPWRSGPGSGCGPPANWVVSSSALAMSDGIVLDLTGLDRVLRIDRHAERGRRRAGDHAAAAPYAPGWPRAWPWRRSASATRSPSAGRSRRRCTRAARRSAASAPGCANSNWCCPTAAS